MSHLRTTLLNLCSAYVNQRLQAAQEAINAAQEAAQAEEKSSAGDKYETGRAMAHLEKEKALLQWHEANRLKADLEKVARQSVSDSVGLGSIVVTNSTCYYVSIGAGTLRVDGIDYLALSPASPLGQLLMKRKAGDRVLFQNKSHTILAVH